MKLRVKIIPFFLIIVGFLLIGLSMNAFAEGTEKEGILPNLGIEASGTFDVYSKYIWRGFALDTDPVLQPGFNLSSHGFTFSFWSSWDFDNNDSLDSDEIDYVLDYTKEFEYLSASAGHTYYEFPGIDTFSKEFYVSLGLTNMPLSPALTYYYDYGDEVQGGGDGQYVTLDVSHSFTLIEEMDVTLDLNGRVGYNKELFIAGEGGDGLVSAGLSIPLTKDLSISPSVNYAMPFGDIDDSSDGNQRDRFYYGVSLAYSL